MKLVLTEKDKGLLKKSTSARDNQYSDILSHFNDYISLGGADAAVYLLAAIVESSDDAILSKDLDGVVTSWNPAAEKLYGYRRNEIIGKDVQTLYPKDRKDEFREIMDIIKKGGRVEYFDTVRIRKDGARIEVSASVSPILGPNGKIIGASSIARDITEKRELDRRKDEFISVASHELKTPVTIIKGFSQVVSNYLKKSEDSVLKGYFEKMEVNVDRLAILLDDLLDVSKIQSGSLKLEKERFDIDELIKEISSDMGNINAGHKILIKGRAGKKIYGDRFRIGQVLTNLLSNAMKYSPKNDKVFVKVKRVGNGVRVEVADFGIGISGRDQKKIFEKFFQAENKIRKSYSGLGLGLYISNEIVRRHGGRISVESIKGVGSTFAFYLPFR